MKLKKYKPRKGHAYLLESGQVLICCGTWNDGLKLFERSEGKTPFCSGFAKYIEAVNRIWVGEKEKGVVG